MLLGLRDGRPLPKVEELAQPTLLECEDLLADCRKRRWPVEIFHTANALDAASLIGFVLGVENRPGRKATVTVQRIAGERRDLPLARIECIRFARLGDGR